MPEGTNFSSINNLSHPLEESHHIQEQDQESYGDHDPNEHEQHEREKKRMRMSLLSEHGSNTHNHNGPRREQEEQEEKVMVNHDSFIETLHESSTDEKVSHENTDHPQESLEVSQSAVEPGEEEEGEEELKNHVAMKARERLNEIRSRLSTVQDDFIQGMNQVVQNFMNKLGENMYERSVKCRSMIIEVEELFEKNNQSRNQLNQTKDMTYTLFNSVSERQNSPQ